MGSRANYVIVDDEGRRLYYSHWGAQQVDVQLAGGWLPAVQFVEAQQRRSPAPDDPDTGWLDDRWAEGGALIDLRRRHLLFFGGFEFMPALHYRRAYFALLAQTWPGWTTQWAYRGLSQLAEYVGVDPAVADVPELLGRGPGPGPLPPAEPTELAAGGDGRWTLVTVREPDGSVRAFATEDSPHPVVLGPAMARMIPAGPDAQTLLERAEVAPGGGAHVEVTARQLTWWSAAEQPILFKDLPALWADWDVQFHADDYEGHLAASGLRLPPVDLSRGLAELEERLSRQYGDPAENALDLARMLRDTGADVQITAPIAAHTQIERPVEVGAIIAEGLRAARRAAGLT
jgi:hypothetical protein